MALATDDETLELGEGIWLELGEDGFLKKGLMSTRSSVMLGHSARMKEMAWSAPAVML